MPGFYRILNSGDGSEAGFERFYKTQSRLLFSPVVSAVVSKIVAGFNLGMLWAGREYEVFL